MPQIHQRVDAVRQAAVDFAECVYEASIANGKPPGTTASSDTGITPARLRQELTQYVADLVVRVAVRALDADESSAAGTQAAYGLTTAESRVAVLLTQRKTAREIASEMRITEHTARRHTEHVMKKLRIHSRREVVRMFRQEQHLL